MAQGIFGSDWVYRTPVSCRRIADRSFLMLPSTVFCFGQSCICLLDHFFLEAQGRSEERRGRAAELLALRSDWESVEGLLLAGSYLVKR